MRENGREREEERERERDGETGAWYYEVFIRLRAKNQQGVPLAYYSEKSLAIGMYLESGGG